MAGHGRIQPRAVGHLGSHVLQHFRQRVDPPSAAPGRPATPAAGRRWSSRSDSCVKVSASTSLLIRRRNANRSLRAARHLPALRHAAETATDRPAAQSLRADFRPRSHRKSPALANCEQYRQIPAYRVLSQPSLVTRNTSSTDVMPARTLSQPSMRRVFMPASTAAFLTTFDGLRSLASARISSLATSNS